MIATPQTSCACLGCFLSFPHQASIDPKSVPFLGGPLWGSGPANTGTFRPFPNRNLHEFGTFTGSPGVFVRCQPTMPASRAGTKTGHKVGRPRPVVSLQR